MVNEIRLQNVLFQICGNMLVGVCNDQTIKKEKGEQLSGVLTQVKKKIPNWDSEKCSVTE